MENAGVVRSQDRGRRKAFAVIGWLLFFLTVFIPTCKIVTAFWGYEVTLRRALALAALTATTAVAAVVLAALSDRHKLGRVFSVMIPFLTPLSLVNALSYVGHMESPALALSMLIYVGCCVALAVQCYRPCVSAVIAIVIAVLMIPLDVFGLMIGGVLVDFGENTVVTSAVSPDGRYVAEVIDSDQGALGGNTIVEVRENAGFEAFFFSVRKRAERVYRGEWGEYKNMEIYWRNNYQLVVNSETYTFD